MSCLDEEEEYASSSDDEDGDNDIEEDEDEESDDVPSERLEELDFEAVFKESHEGETPSSEEINVKYNDLKELFQKLLNSHENVKLDNIEYGKMYEKINKENDELVEEVENFKDQLQSAELKHQNDEMEIYKKVICEKTDEVVNILYERHKEELSKTAVRNKEVQHYKQNQEITLMNQRLREEINKLDAKAKKEILTLKAELDKQMESKNEILKKYESAESEFEKAIESIREELSEEKKKVKEQKKEYESLKQQQQQQQSSSSSSSVVEKKEEKEKEEEKKKKKMEEVLRQERERLRKDLRVEIRNELENEFEPQMKLLREEVIRLQNEIQDHENGKELEVNELEKKYKKLMKQKLESIKKEHEEEQLMKEKEFKEKYEFIKTRIGNKNVPKVRYERLHDKYSKILNQFKNLKGQVDENHQKFKDLNKLIDKKEKSLLKKIRSLRE